MRAFREHRRRVIGGCTSLLLLLATSACSFVAVRPTPRLNETTGQLECGVRPAIGDMVGAGTVAAGTAIAHYLSSIGAALCDPEPGRTCPAPSAGLPIAGAIAAGALLASSMYGLAATGKCQERLDHARARGDLRALDEALRKERAAPRAEEPEEEAGPGLRR
jgi:hypothetical protein